MNTATACTHAGVSFRQADYMVSQGLIPGQTSEGQGRHRVWTAQQTAMLALTAALRQLVPFTQLPAELRRTYTAWLDEQTTTKGWVGWVVVVGAHLTVCDDPTEVARTIYTESACHIINLALVAGETER